ncbi:MAG TPA: VCBS repeat-containing protein [Verrucomicrobiae bacterium]|jgi:hypothetical protein
MKSNLLLLTQATWLIFFANPSSAAEFRFQHHFISRDLPIGERGTGDYGLTALVDLDRDGDLDFVLGGRGVKPERLYWFEFRGATNWIQHVVGTNYQSDVGIAALDVDGDGWTDLVCSGVWYRNPGKPTSEPFQRLVFATNAAGAHDILAADIDGDGRRDIVMMGDERTPLKSLCWFKISTDPKKLWERHHIGPAVHGAITPNGVTDLDGDGDLDVVRADAWFENHDGKRARLDCAHEYFLRPRGAIWQMRAHRHRGHGRRWQKRNRNGRRGYHRLSRGDFAERRWQGRTLVEDRTATKLHLRFPARTCGRRLQR